MTKIKNNIEQLIFCKYSKLMSALKEPRKTMGINLNNTSQFAESGIFVKEDDQDWGSSGMNNVEQEPDLR